MEDMKWMFSLAVQTLVKTPTSYIALAGLISQPWLSLPATEAQETAVTAQGLSVLCGILVPGFSPSPTLFL